MHRDHPVSVIETMPRIPDARRLRLFACACCHRIWSLLVTEELRNGVESAEALADGQLAPPDLETAQILVEPFALSEIPPHYHSNAVAWALSSNDDFALIAGMARDAVALGDRGVGGVRHRDSASIKSEQREQVSFARDIFGNRFAVAFSSEGHVHRHGWRVECDRDFTRCRSWRTPRRWLRQRRHAQPPPTAGRACRGCWVSIWCSGRRSRDTHALPTPRGIGSDPRGLPAWVGEVVEYS